MIELYKVTSACIALSYMNCIELRDDDGDNDDDNVSLGIISKLT